MIERLVLASASPRRRRLLSLLGIPFTVIAAKVDETAREDEDAQELVRRIEYIELSARPDFNDHFVRAMTFPERTTEGIENTK